MRPDYCPIGNEPCQSLCDTPCSTQQKYTTDAMKVRQAVAQALAQSEPVAYIRVSKTGNVMACAKSGDFYALPDKTLLYTTPPQRTWAGLTDEEVWECYSGQGSVFYRAIEAKLREKNCSL